MLRGLHVSSWHKGLRLESLTRPQDHHQGPGPNPGPQRGAPPPRPAWMLRVCATAYLPSIASDDSAPGATTSFVGIFSLYYSLQYLSLSDATVLQFLAPIFTAISGAVLLREPLSWREAAAGSQYHSSV